jgi:hypothetical protein
MKKAVLVIGENAFAGLRNSIISALAQINWQIDTIDLPPLKPKYLGSLAYRIPQFSMLYRENFIKSIDSLPKTKYKFVLIIKGPFINNKIINKLREKTSAPIVCWNPDSPIDQAISNHGAGMNKVISSYDAYVTWADDIAEHISQHNPNVEVIPFAWDPQIHYFTAGKGIAKDRIVFIGTCTDVRIKLLSKLAHLNPLIFGNNWPKIKGLEILPPVYGTEMSSIIGEAKWALNILNIQNQKSHNMRTFEIPGVGGNQVTSCTNDHVKYLREDSRTILYASNSDLVDILLSDPANLEPRNQNLLRHHTYLDRVIQLVKFLGVSD